MQHTEQDEHATLPNGPAAASTVAAGAGCCAMGVFYVLGNASAACNRLFSIYPPTGALSGVATAGCFAWLAIWIVLHRRWQKQDVRLRAVSTWSLLLLASGLLLTFPPIARLF